MSKESHQSAAAQPESLAETPLWNSSWNAGPNRPHLRRNVGLLLVHGLLGQTGFRLLQAPTFLPAFIQQLTGLEFAVGAARAAQSVGMFLSPLVGASWIGRRARLRGAMIAIGMSMRVQIGLLAVLALWVPVEVGIWLIWPVLFLWGLASGLQMVTFNLLLARLVPIRLRGRLWGVRNLGSGLTLLAVSALAGRFLTRYGFPFGYGLAFATSFVLTTLGVFFLFFLREQQAPQEDLPAPTRLPDRLRQVGLLWHQPNFGRFLRAVTLATASRGALPFFIVAFVARSDESAASGTLLAVSTIAFSAAQAVGALGWGVLADHGGYRRVFRLAQGCWLIASVTAAVMPTQRLVLPIFALLGAGLSGTMISQSSLVLEFGKAEERAVRVAAANTLAEGCGTLAFLIAGLLASLLPFWVLFTSAAVLQLLAILQLGQMAEPRRT